MWHMHCAVMSDVENDAMCCQMWWYDVKSRYGGVMRCGIWCGVKCAVMLNLGVVWNSCGCRMV